MSGVPEMRFILVLACLTAFSPAAWCVEWRLTVRDDLERDAVGDAWAITGGTGVVAQGALEVRGASVQLLHSTLIGRDVQIQARAAILPEAATTELTGLLHTTSGHHARFSVQLVPEGKATITTTGFQQSASLPAPVPAVGEAFQVTARREGRHLSLLVNDTRILDGTLERIIGAEGIGRFGFVVSGAARLDEIELRSRVPSHPDCCPPPLPYLPLTRTGRTVSRVGEVNAADAPGFERGIVALNDRDFETARREFEAVEDATLRLTGLAYLLGDLDYREKAVYGDLSRTDDRDYAPEEIEPLFGEFGVFARRWEEAAHNDPANEILNLYLPHVRHFGKLTLNRWTMGRHAEALVDLDRRINPFADKATLYAARVQYWNAMEGGDQPKREAALKRMRGLRSTWPDNDILRQYLGPPVPWGESLNADAEAHPEWAAYLREAYVREVTILERFLRLRQQDDGQLGGGWGDDVELLRKWTPIAAISTSAAALRDGIERLTEGVWTYACEDGFELGERQIGDVEHSAEPSADSFPGMLLLRYGDPRYVEFNLRSAKTIRERFMGIDERGHPRFKSSFFDASGVAIHDRSGGDTGYHARPMKHFYWLAWYGHPEAGDWFVRWADGWRETALMEDDHKPYGVLPGTLWYPSGSWYAPNGKPWYDRDAWPVYEAWGLPNMIYGALFQAHEISGDPKFLMPFRVLMDWASNGPYPRGGTPRPGSPEWCLEPMMHIPGAQLTALYRHYTGETVYDEYTKRFGNAPQLFQIDRDRDRYLASFRNAAESLRTNIDFWTTEILSTDRMHLPSVNEVFGAYTGALTLTGDVDPVTFGVTYETPTSDFAALVVENTPARLRIWLYGFWDGPTTIHLLPWRLVPGRYTLMEGPRLPGEQPIQSRYGWREPRTVDLAHRAQAIPVTLPPHTEYVVDLRLEEPAPDPGPLPDLAVDKRSLRVTGSNVIVRVHNIGGADAADCEVALQREENGAWRTLVAERFESLSAPVQFAPSHRDVVLLIRTERLSGRFRVIVDPVDAVREIVETNNTVEFDR